MNCCPSDEDETVRGAESPLEDEDFDEDFDGDFADVDGNLVTSQFHNFDITSPFFLF